MCRIYGVVALLLFWPLLAQVGGKTNNVKDVESVAQIKTVHFDLKTCILHFEVMSGEKRADGKIVRKKKAKYAIDFHSSPPRMYKNGGHPLPFSEAEQQQMHDLLNKFVRQYAFESFMWYEKGGPRIPDSTSNPTRDPIKL